MSPMTDPPDVSDLARLPDARLLRRALLPPLAPLGLGGLLALVPPAALVAPEGQAWLPAGALALAFLLSLAFLIDASAAWADRGRARRLLDVPLPDVAGLWQPEALPLSAHGRLALAQAAPVPRDWAVGHDGRHAYVVERFFGRWRRLARRPR